MITVWKADGYWWWKCSFCCPPAVGHRKDWSKIFTTSLPRHFRVRDCHHRWARGRRTS